MKRDRPGELIQHAAGVDCQTGKCHALGTTLEGEDFDWVESLQWRQADRVDGSEEEDHGHRGLCGAFVGGVRVRVRRSRSRDANPNDTTARHREQH